MVGPGNSFSSNRPENLIDHRMKPSGLNGPIPHTWMGEKATKNLSLWLPRSGIHRQERNEISKTSPTPAAAVVCAIDTKVKLLGSFSISCPWIMFAARKITINQTTFWEVTWWSRRENFSTSYISGKFDTLRGTGACLSQIPDSWYIKKSVLTKKINPSPYVEYEKTTL